MVTIKNFNMPRRCAECKLCVNQKTNDYGSFGKCSIMDKQVDCLMWSRDSDCPIEESEG